MMDEARRSLYDLARQALGSLEDASGFRADPVPPALLDEMIAVAAGAPQASRFSGFPWRFVVVVGDEREVLVARVAEALARRWGLGSFGPRGLASDEVLQAPAILLAFSTVPTSEGLEGFGVVASAVQNFILLAHAAGLASHRIYSAHMVPEALLDFVGERLGPEIRGGELVAMLALGYPAVPAATDGAPVPVERAGSDERLPPARAHWLGGGPGSSRSSSLDLSPGPAHKPAPILRSQRGERVLIADPYPYNRDLLTAHLAAADYSVRACSQGAELLATVAADGAPDLYIIAETLPDTTGFELARRLRGEEPYFGTGTPIVVTTGRRNSAFRIAGLSAGVDYYLRKPVHPMELYTVVRMLIERHRLFDELRNANEEQARLLDALGRAQARLVQQAKMASLGQLVAGVAHEINTPLGAVVSNNDLFLRAFDRLRRRLDSDAVTLDAAARRDLDAVASLTDVTRLACERITGIVRTLRIFARLDEAELKSVDLHEGIDSTLVLIAHLLKGGITVERRYGELPPVECHPNQINQVFMNLLVNACQAIDGAGRIVIETSLDTGPGCCDDFVRVVITDSGRGITPEQLPRIFDPGYTTKGVGVGTGLGLSICYQIIEAHGGEITVASTPGQGTSFLVRLPRCVRLAGGA